MKLRMRIWTAVPVMVALSAGGAMAQGGRGRGGGIPAPIKVTVSGYSDGGEIPAKYTCATQGSGSPMIEWSGAPANTAAYAIIFHDADVAPQKTAQDVTHWIIWNIPGSAKELPASVPNKGELEDGARQGKNIANMTGYFGPCPPAGLPHHYIFEIYALDQKLDLPADSSRADLEKAMDGHVIAKGYYVGTFKR